MARMVADNAGSLKTPLLADRTGQQQQKQQQKQNPSTAMSRHEQLQSETSSLSHVEIGDDGPSEAGASNRGGGQMLQPVKSSNWRLFGLGMFFLFYLAFGATVFSSIERPLEKRIVDELMARKREFLDMHKECLNDDDLEEFMGEIVAANNRGVEIFKNGTSVSSWTFGQSFFFSSTVVTTIGYGHQTPLSSEGKLFCMAYAVLGIPMTLLLLAAVVERALVPVDAVLAMMLRKMQGRIQPVYVYVMHFSMVASGVILLLFLLPALLFMWLEPHWGFLDSLYYCFISLTTVGLGDFIPGDSPGQKWRPLYKACTTFYLLVGVTAMMLSLAVFYRIPRCDLRLLFLLPQSAGDCLKGGVNGVAATIAANAGSSTGPSSAAASTADPERIRLQTAGAGSRPKYTQQRDEDEDRRQKNVIRARARPNDDDDSSSPAEESRPRPSTSRGTGRKPPPPVPSAGARGKR